MSASTNVAPVIIKRKKIISGGGHHGGAWKVAYADFVTAMMAFFMLMWLLNATTEKQRKGIADYFSPTIPINRVSGGGDGPFGGDSLMSEQELPQNGIGASRRAPTESRQARGETGTALSNGESDASSDNLNAVEEALLGRSGESMVSKELQRHIVTRVTDEGLVIELSARDGAPLFDAHTDRPTPLLRELARIIVRVSDIVTNDIALGGYVRAHPVVLADNPVWDLSAQRANRMRILMQELGSQSDRFRRVTGYADRQPVMRDPMSNRNNRIEVVLLRK